MWYHKARTYSPTLGRFMPADPIGYGDGMNRYNYVGSDPVNFVDPLGLEFRCMDSSYFEWKDAPPPSPDPNSNDIIVNGGRLVERAVTQCWATTYETLRSKEEWYQLYIIENPDIDCLAPDQAKDVVKNSKEINITSSTPQPTGKSGKAAHLRFASADARQWQIRQHHRALRLRNMND